MTANLSNIQWLYSLKQDELKSGFIECVNSVFEQPWYIDAASNGKAQTIAYEKGGNQLAWIPFVIKKRFGKNVITNPPFMQTCGVCYADPDWKQTRHMESQKDAINAMIDKLPKRTSVDLYLCHCCQYVLPWIWRGFKVTPFFSYRIRDLSDETACWNNLRYSTRNNIRKAQKLVHVRDDMPIETLIEIQDKTFARQHRGNPFDVEGFLRLHAALTEHNACKLLCAVDEEDRVHAAAYFVYDKHCCYYIYGGGDPELRNSGAAPLLVWEGIRFASTVSEIFDFEGSMIESIERFFRAFGGKPEVYYRVTRLCARHRFAEWIKPTVKQILGYK